MLAGNHKIHKSLDEFKIWRDPTPDHRVTCLLASKNRCCHYFSAVFHPILFIYFYTYRYSNDYMHESSREFEIRQDSTNDCRVSFP